MSRGDCQKEHVSQHTNKAVPMASLRFQAERGKIARTKKLL